MIILRKINFQLQVKHLRFSLYCYSSKYTPSRPNYNYLSTNIPDLYFFFFILFQKYRDTSSIYTHTLNFELLQLTMMKLKRPSFMLPHV